MGIRVVCPNGHKLNVKAFLAGKRGVCPHCQAKFDIPAQAEDEPGPDSTVQKVGGMSTAPAPAGGAATAQAPSSTASAELRATHAAKGTPRATLPSPAAQRPAVAPSTPVAASAAQPATAQPMVVAAVPMAGPSGVAAAPGVPAAVPVQAVPMTQVAVAAPIRTAPLGVAPVGVAPVGVAPVVADPLQEAPDANWYVRPPSGGQYGPAKAPVMRQWIAEGRVTGDSLVWREGWPDWKLASATFAALGAAPGAPQVVIAAAAPLAAGPVPAAAAPADEAADPFSQLSSPSTTRKAIPYRRDDGTARMVAIGFLCVALVVLSSLLVYVLKMQ